MASNNFEPVENVLKPRTMLITGAAKRIGRDLALQFARQGWAIAVHHRKSEVDARDVVAQIVSTGGRAAAFAADLSDQRQVENLLPACIEALGPVTCLINNASGFRYDDISSLQSDQWDTHLAVNLKAPVFLAKALSEHLAKLPAGQFADGATGNVINIIDQRVWNLAPDFFSYTIAKSGLWTATRTLAQALAPRIRVNAIGPGPVLKSIHQTKADFDKEARSTLLGRGTTTGEIAAAISFIIDAPAMTGQMIALDGGQHLGKASVAE